jgi:tetratricopeptide (TPR) repeat protein
MPSGDVICSIDLKDSRTGAVTARSICNPDGGFQFNEVPQGEYTVQISMGIQQYERAVSVQALQEDLDITLPTTASNPHSGGTVSVQELRIPEKAKEKVDKAAEELAHRDLNKADQHLTDALKIAPRFARAVAMRGAVEMVRGDFSSALHSSEYAISIDPMLALGQVVRASALNSMGQAKEAKFAAEQGIRLDSSGWQGHFELARALITEGEFRQALSELNRVVNSAPQQFHEALLLRASVLLNLHNVPAAEQDLDRYAKARPDDPRVQQLRRYMSR